MKTYKSIPMWLILSSIMVAVTVSPYAFAAKEPYVKRENGLGGLNADNPDRQKIQTVLESKIEDAQILHKVKKKLSNLEEKKVQVISSLCMRITEENRPVREELAFLLIISMIILS